MVEAQLLGVPAIAPNYGNFPNIIWSGKNGFIYNTIEEAYQYIEEIQNNKYLLDYLKNNSQNFSKSIWCDINNQVDHWEKVFEISNN
jgi:glycosyltransferase involved in cell wall biosynthesis